MKVTSKRQVNALILGATTTLLIAGACGCACTKECCKSDDPDGKGRGPAQTSPGQPVKSGIPAPYTCGGTITSSVRYSSWNNGTTQAPFACTAGKAYNVSVLTQINGVYTPLGTNHYGMQSAANPPSNPYVCNTFRLGSSTNFVFKPVITANYWFGALFDNTIATNATIAELIVTPQ